MTFRITENKIHWTFDTRGKIINRQIIDVSVVLPNDERLSFAGFLILTIMIFRIENKKINRKSLTRKCAQIAVLIAENIFFQSLHA